MNKLCFLVVLFCSLTLISQNNNKIGINTPNPKAALDIQSTNSGVLLPRLTNLQVNNISNPPLGLMVYNLDYNCVMFNNSSNPSSPKWNCLSHTIQNINTTTYNGGFPKNYGGGGDDQGYEIFSQQNGNLVVFSTTTSDDFDVSESNNTDIWITEINSTGGIIKNKVVGGNNYEQIHWITKRTDGYYGLIETTSFNFPMYDKKSGTAFIKLDNNFNVVWVKPAFVGKNMYSNDNRSNIKYFHQSTSGNYYFLINNVGNSGIFSDNTDNKNFCIVVTNDQFDVQSKTYIDVSTGITGNGKRITNMTLLSDGNIAYCATTSYDGGGIYIVKLTTSGNEVWNKYITNSSNGSIHPVILRFEERNAEIYVEGNKIKATVNFSGTETSNQTNVQNYNLTKKILSNTQGIHFEIRHYNASFNYAMKLAKVNSNTNTDIWEKDIVPNGNDPSYVIHSLTEFGNLIYCTGEVYSEKQSDITPTPIITYGQYDMLILKLDSDGNKIFD